jgi:hypothetical protein
MKHCTELYEVMDIFHVVSQIMRILQVYIKIQLQNSLTNETIAVCLASHSNLDRVSSQKRE